MFLTIKNGDRWGGILSNKDLNPGLELTARHSPY
jgi:hypothetical protein